MKAFKIGNRALPEFWGDLEKSITAHGAYIRENPDTPSSFFKEFVLMTKEEFLELLCEPRRSKKSAEDSYESMFGE